ncbi:hypothetical protein F4604DRAFT_1899120 [Suillus subluteus]|nr:hypothetical protein F4604DRAFT_1899120 [Suillus subluteus]
MRFDTFVCTALSSSKMSVATQEFGDAEQDKKGLHCHRPAINPLKSNFESNLPVSGEACATLSSCFMFTSDADFNIIVVIAAFMFPTQYRRYYQYFTLVQNWNKLCIPYITLVVLRQPHGLQQAIYGHLQALTNHADEWSPFTGDVVGPRRNLVSSCWQYVNDAQRYSQWLGTLSHHNIRDESRDAERQQLSNRWR